MASLAIQDTFAPYYDGRDGESKAGRDDASSDVDQPSPRRLARPRPADNAAWNRLEKPTSKS